MSNMKKTLVAADSVLEKLGRLKAAIQREIEGPLAAAIQDCTAAEIAIEAAEVAVVVDAEPHGGEIDKAQKRLASGHAGIDKSAERLNGLRNAGIAFVPQIIGAADALAAALPGHYREVAEAFKPRWRAAAEQFAAILAERQQIEAAIGDRLPLEDPAPAPAAEANPEISRPGLALRELGKAVKAAAALHSKPTNEQIDPHRIFVLWRPSEGLPAGTLVVSCSLSAGRLEGLVAIDLATPWVSPAVKLGRRLARQAELDLDVARRQRIADANETQGKALAAERKAFEERNYPEQKPVTEAERESNWVKSFRPENLESAAAPEN